MHGSGRTVPVARSTPARAQLEPEIDSSESCWTHRRPTHLPRPVKFEKKFVNRESIANVSKLEVCVSTNLEVKSRA